MLTKRSTHTAAKDVRKQLSKWRISKLAPFWDLVFGCVTYGWVVADVFGCECTCILYTVGVQFTRSILVVLALSTTALAGTPQPAASLRWAEGSPGCTVRRSEDGRTYYNLATTEFDLTLAVDNQELEKVHHRAVPILGILVSLTYKGNRALLLQPSQSTLEFSKHFQVVQRSLDPNNILQLLQQDIDELTDEVTHHELRKHPELKDAKEAELQQRLKDYTEMMDFLSTSTLRDGGLDASKAGASGWVFFSTQSRWIGPWRRPEQFVFTIPVGKALVEMPFELPPKGGKIELRPRAGQ